MEFNRVYSWKFRRCKSMFDPLLLGKKKKGTELLIHSIFGHRIKKSAWWRELYDFRGHFSKVFPATLSKWLPIFCQIDALSARLVYTTYDIPERWPLTIVYFILNASNMLRGNFRRPTSSFLEQVWKTYSCIYILYRLVILRQASQNILTNFPQDQK